MKPEPRPTWRLMIDLAALAILAGLVIVGAVAIWDYVSNIM